MQSDANARALCVLWIRVRLRAAGRSHNVTRRDLAFHYHLGIDAEVTVPKGAHQRLRNSKMADTGRRIDLGGCAAHDPFNDFKPRAFADRDLPPNQIKLAPRRPAAHI